MSQQHTVSFHMDDDKLLVTLDAMEMVPACKLWEKSARISDLETALAAARKEIDLLNAKLRDNDEGVL